MFGNQEGMWHLECYRTQSGFLLLTLEQDSGKQNSEYNGNKPSLKAIECLASTAEILHPKRGLRVEELSTLTFGYFQNKRPDRLGEDQRLRV